MCFVLYNIPYTGCMISGQQKYCRVRKTAVWNDTYVRQEAVAVTHGLAPIFFPLLKILTFFDVDNGAAAVHV